MNDLLLLLGIHAGIMGLVIYFVRIHRSKKRKAWGLMIANISKGDKVVSIGGMCGAVVEVREKTVIVKVDDNTEFEFQKTKLALDTEAVSYLH